MRGVRKVPLGTSNNSSNLAQFLAEHFSGHRGFSRSVCRVRGLVGVASMKRLSLCVFGLLSGLLAITPVSAQSANFTLNEKASPFMRVYGPSQPPYGFVRFCEMTPEACQPQRLVDVRFQPTPERLSEIDEVNRSVNRAIKPATDQEIYGVSEYWTLPTDRGDCEDYALLKQKVLAERGWPMSALL